jgi:uncharacterized protein YciI
MTTRVLVMALCLISFFAKGQSVKNEQAFETFEHKSGDTTYIMKKYFICLLKKGENRSHDKEATAKIQEGHMNHIAKMAADGTLAIAGPMGDDGELSGIFILNVPTLEEAEKLVNEDPAIKSGRLKAKIHPWWAAKGSVLP